MKKKYLVLGCVVGLQMASCGHDDSNGPGGSGGATGSGGKSDPGDTGGRAGTGGNKASGGSNGSGGDALGGMGQGGEGGNWEVGAFVTSWEIAAGNSLERTIVLPLVAGGSYDFVVDWGDGTTGEVTDYDDEDAQHKYKHSGEYEVVMTGEIRGWSFQPECYTYSGEGYYEYYEICSPPSTVYNLREVKQWGSLDLGETTDQFSGCRDLLISAADGPQLGTSLRGMFSDCENLVLGAGVEQWDTSKVTDMSYMFKIYETVESDTRFEHHLSAWDTSNVTDMREMFSGTPFNDDLSTWDTSNVTDMHKMFYYTPFNGDLSTWDTSSVTDMARMFESSDFNGDLST